MIEITATLIPYGDRSLKSEEIAKGTIANIGYDGDMRFNYKFHFEQPGNEQVKALEFNGTVEHKRHEGILKLLYLSLKEHFEPHS